jgi:hypothetical protein
MRLRQLAQAQIPLYQAQTTEAQQHAEQMRLANVLQQSQLTGWEMIGDPNITKESTEQPTTLPQPQAAATVPIVPQGSAFPYDTVYKNLTHGFTGADGTVYKPIIPLAARSIMSGLMGYEKERLGLTDAERAVHDPVIKELGNGLADVAAMPADKIAQGLADFQSGLQTNPPVGATAQDLAPLLKIGVPQIPAALGALRAAGTMIEKSKAASEAGTAAATEQKAEIDTALAATKFNVTMASKSGDFDAQIDAIAPPTMGNKPGPFATLNASTKAIVNSELGRHDIEAADKTISEAFRQIGEINKETNPQVIAARAQGAAQIQSIVEPLRQQILVQFQNNKDARDKIETTYLQPYQSRMSQLDELDSTIAQASTNPVAAKMALYKLTGLAMPVGGKRFSPVVVSGVASMGSLPERAKQSISNALSGDQWTPEMTKDIQDYSVSQRITTQNALKNGIDVTNKLYNTKVGTGLGTAAPSGFADWKKTQQNRQ